MSRFTLNQDAVDHVKQPLTCDGMQQHWSVSLKQDIVPELFIWGMVGCHGSQTDNNQTDQISGSGPHQHEPKIHSNQYCERFDSHLEVFEFILGDELTLCFTKILRAKRVD